MKRVLFPLLMLVSATVAIFSAIDMRKAVKALSWPMAQGTLYSSRLIAKGELHGRFSSPAPVYTYEETIEYQAGGQVYYKTILTITSLKSLLLSYNPKRPTEIWIGPKGPSVFETFLLIAAVAALVVAGFQWARQERRERQAAPRKRR